MGDCLFVGGLAQLLAGMWCINKGNMYGGTFFSAYGGFFLGYSALYIKAFGFLDGFTGAGALNDLHREMVRRAALSPYKRYTI